MGSGHILVYMFDVLVQIYESYGYNAREAAGLILQNNLYGLDIDDRAAQLAYFAVMMKARQYDRRIFSRGIQPHVYAIVESNNISRDFLDYFENGRDDLTNAMETVVRELHDAKEYGSILNVTRVDFAALYARLDEITEDISMYAMPAQNELRPLIEVAEVMAQQYHTVATNPPYMAISSASTKLNSYVNENYVGGKTDLFSAFIEKCVQMTSRNSFTSMITMQSWMFLTSFEKIRDKVLQSQIVNMAHLGPRGFDEINGEVVQTVSFVIQKTNKTRNYIGKYSRLIDGNSEAEKERMFISHGFEFTAKTDSFDKIPQKLFAYWVGEQTVKCFESPNLSEIFITREGMATADNDRFLRLWYEVSYDRVTFNCSSAKDGLEKNIKWVPYNKGGTSRHWYGNNDYVVDWSNDGAEIKHNIDPKTGRIRSHNYNGEYGFRSGLTWSAISSGNLAVRYCPSGFLFDSKGAKGFAKSEVSDKWILGLLNSKVAMQFLQFISPTLDFKVGDVISLPYKDKKEYRGRIDELVTQAIKDVKDDWDSFETSWDFQTHPLISVISKNCALFDDTANIDLAECYRCWEIECNERFERLKTTEEELNRIFIEVYGLDTELSSAVDVTDISVRRADIKRDIRSLISYAVGCMFGRYNLGMKGLAYAGGTLDYAQYPTYPVDKDNIIPICNDDYFDDDILGRFVKWIETVFGCKSVETNLKFIADALGGKGTSREVIRNYFINDFYADHCNTCSVAGSGKRPIYWLFDSGKQNGFKALIYMHRYQPDTIARIRTDYVHEQQSRYRTAIADLENRINSASTGERVKLSKQLQKLHDQAEEIRIYEEKIHHLADMMIPIDLDDGVKVNYAKFEDVLAKIK